QVTKMVHGEEAMSNATGVSAILFSDFDPHNVKASVFDEMAKEIPTASVSANNLGLVDALVKAGLEAVGISFAISSNTLALTLCGSKSLKRMALTPVALDMASSPCTIFVTSVANVPCASRRLGSFSCAFMRASISCRGSNVKSFRYDSTCPSSVLYQ